MSPLSVPHFSPIGAHIRALWRILQSVRKEEEKKRRKKTPKFGHLYLENGWSNFLQIWNVDSPYLAGTSVATLVSIG